MTAERGEQRIELKSKSSYRTRGRARSLTMCRDVSPMVSNTVNQLETATKKVNKPYTWQNRQCLRRALATYSHHAPKSEAHMVHVVWVLVGYECENAAAPRIAPRAKYHCPTHTCLSATNGHAREECLEPLLRACWMKVGFCNRSVRCAMVSALGSPGRRCGSTRGE